MDTFQAVKETISKELVAFPLPGFLDKGIELLTRTHFYYRIFKQIKIYQKGAKKPLDEHPAIYGAALHLAGSTTKIGACALNLALATKCTLDLLGEYRQLSNSWQKLCQAVDCRHPPYIPVRLNQNNENFPGLLPPHQFILWRVQIIEFSKQITIIARLALDVFLQLFKLSMCLCEAKLLLVNNDPQMQFECCTELFANWDSYQVELQHHANKIAEVIHQGCKVADTLLEKVGIQRKSSAITEELIHGVPQKKSKTKKVKEKKKGLSMNDVIHHAANMGEVVISRYYIPGKITALHFDHSEGHTTRPLIPAGRFPPWGGQTIKVRALVDSRESSTESGNENWGYTNFEWNHSSLPILEIFGYFLGDEKPPQKAPLFNESEFNKSDKN